MTLFKQFLNDIQNPNTKRQYTTTITSFDTFCNRDGIDPVDNEYRKMAQVIRAWVTQNGWTDNTARARVACIGSFYKWLKRQGWWDYDNPTEAITIVEKEVESFVPESISPELGDKVIAHYESKLNRRDTISYRNYIMVLILRYGGVRVSELLDLRLKDINLETGDICIKHAKRNKWRYTRVNTKTVTALKNWLKNFGMELDDYLFLNPKTQKPITAVAVTLVLTKGAVGAKLTDDEIKQIGHPHSWRHLWIAGLVEKGVPLTTIAKMSGHESMDMIYYYARTVQTDLATEGD
jgi:site-specific recombinase XerD